MLAPHRVGDPSTGRAFARPFRGSPHAVRGRARGLRPSRGRARALPARVHRRGVTIRGLVAPWTSRRATWPRTGWCSRTRASTRPGRRPRRTDAEMQLNPAPILLVHRGPAGARGPRLLPHAADHEYTDRAHQQHRVWAIREPESGRARRALADSRALIADGHHRYAAYLACSSAARRPPRTGPGDAGRPGRHAALPRRDPPDHSLGDHSATLRSAGRVRRPSALPTEAAMAALVDRERWSSPTEREWATRRAVTAGGLVAVLHESCCPALGRDRSATTTRRRRPAAAARSAVSPCCCRPPIRQVAGSSGAGQLLPEKATSFQPKPSVGALMRDLRDE